MIKQETALEWVNELNSSIYDGAIDPLLAYTMLHRLKSAVDLTMKSCQDQAVSEAEKYNEKTFKFNGYEITRKAAAGRWDFKHIPQWNQKKAELESVEESHKMAFKLAEKGDVYVNSDGEAVEPAHYSVGKETISLKPIQ